MIKASFNIAGKTLKPYQGLKLLVCRGLNLKIQSRKNPKTLSGIETLALEVAP